MTSWQSILQPMSRLSRRQHYPFAQLPVKYGHQPLLRGEEKLSRGCSSIVRAGAARLIPTP